MVSRTEINSTGDELSGVDMGEGNRAVKENTEKFVIVPYERLSEEALNGILEEYISREGTDYGVVELAMDSKIAKAKSMLVAAKVVIIFDPVLERCQMVNERELSKLNSDD